MLSTHKRNSKHTQKKEVAVRHQRDKIDKKKRYQKTLFVAALKHHLKTRRA